MVDQMETLQSLFTQSETRRSATEDRMLQLAQAVEGLTVKLGPGPVAATERLAAAQERLSQVLEEGQRGGGIDDESRMRLRSIDVQLLKIYEDLGASRNDEVLALRGDLHALTTAIRDLVNAARAPARRPQPAPRPPVQSGE